MAYIHDLEAAETHATPAASKCFLCEAAGFAADSAEGGDRLLLHRDEQALIIMNRYPYTSGHLLVAPREHLADLNDCSANLRAHLMELTAQAQKCIQQAYNPQGMNIGMNLGRCAGAGLPGHLHIHLVPRWNGDTNFMSTIGDVRVIPQALEQSYERLKQAMVKIF